MSGMTKETFSKEECCSFKSSTSCMFECCKHKSEASNLPLRAFGLGVVPPSRQRRVDYISHFHLYHQKMHLESTYRKFKKEFLANQESSVDFIVNQGDCANVALTFALKIVYASPRISLLPGACLLDIFAAFLGALRDRPSVSIQAVLFYRGKQYSMLINSLRENHDVLGKNQIIIHLPIAFIVEKHDNNTGHIVCAGVLPYSVVGLKLPHNLPKSIYS